MFARCSSAVSQTYIQTAAATLLRQGRIRRTSHRRRQTEPTSVNSWMIVRTGERSTASERPAIFLYRDNLSVTLVKEIRFRTSDCSRSS